MVIRLKVPEEGGKHSPQQDETQFLPLFFMIDKGYKKLESFTRDIKMIKDDKGGTRNTYKCMNVMKQVVMDDKIIERCKTCEKQIS